jgi:hypothetical protein
MTAGRRFTCQAFFRSIRSVHSARFARVTRVTWVTRVTGLSARFARGQNVLPPHVIPGAKRRGSKTALARGDGTDSFSEAGKDCPATAAVHSDSQDAFDRIFSPDSKKVRAAVSGLIPT